MSIADEHRPRRPSAHRRGRPGAQAPQRAERPGAAPRGRRRAAHERGRGGAAWPRPPEHRRRRRRDDDHQHGAAAPEHPRGAAAHARAPGRDGAALQAGRRLPPHRHGEDGRGAHVPPGPAPTSPAWTTSRRCSTSWCSRMATEALLEVELPPRAMWIRMLITELNRMASHLLFLATQRHGPRRGVDDALRLARARGGAALLPEDHRPADEPQLHPPRRRGRRPAGRLGRGRRPPPRADPAAARRVRRPHDQPADLARAAAGRRRDHRPGGAGPRRHRPHPALDRRGLGPAPRHALPDLRRGRLRRDRGQLRRRLRPLRRPAGRGPGVDQDRVADPREDAGGRLPGPGQEGHAAAAGPHRRVDGGAHPPLQDLHRGLQGARGRGVRRRREPPRRAGLLPGVRRFRQALPHAHPRPQLREHPDACRT